MTSLHVVINFLADLIAYAGVAVVVTGVVITIGRLIHFVLTGFDQYRAAELRHALMVYLSIGLDFIIAKDVILTLSIQGGDIEAILQLAIVIGIRFLLSFFVHFEERSLHRMGLKEIPVSPEGYRSKRKSKTKNAR